MAAAMLHLLLMHASMQVKATARDRVPYGEFLHLPGMRLQLLVCLAAGRWCSSLVLSWPCRSEI